MSSNFMFNWNNINVALGMWFGVLQWRCLELYVPTTRYLYTGKNFAVLLHFIYLNSGICFTVHCVGWLVNAELEADWKQSAVIYREYYRGMCQEMNHETLVSSDWSSGRDSVRRLPKTDLESSCYTTCSVECTINFTFTLPCIVINFILTLWRRNFTFKF